MKIRLAADLQPDSVVDGEGIRTVIWTQGCPHKCRGCHNPSTHDFEDGLLVDVEEVKKKLAKIKYQNGITFSGGDPLCQPEACLEIANFAKSIGINVWCYTGYTYEQLMIMSKSKKSILNFLKTVDVLIDGRFILEEKSLNIAFRGSKNQRIIDVQKSLKENKVCTIKKYDIKEPLVLNMREQYLFI